MPLLVLLPAIPLWAFGGLWALVVLPAAAASFLATRLLVEEIARAREQKCFLDEQLIQSQKLAAIGELSAGIAHEINNPLAIISQEIEWARYQFEGKSQDGTMDEVRDSLKEIAGQVERCREITHRLLDFARRRDPLIQAVDVNKLIEDMAKLVEKEASQKNIKIVRNYRNDLPRIFTDPPLLRQVVLNLLNNAAHAVGRDGTIEVATRAPGGGRIEFTVVDTGCGIAPENLGKIFDPFYTTKPPGKGTGLGLSICHGIIVRLGGRIDVESEPGRGARFAVSLPVKHNA